MNSRAFAIPSPPLATDRADPSVRDYRIGLLPWVLALKRTSGKGCITRAGGSHRFARRFIRVQVMRMRWLRRRSALNQCRVAWVRKAATAWVFPGTVIGEASLHHAV